MSYPRSYSLMALSEQDKSDLIGMLYSLQHHIECTIESSVTPPIPEEDPERITYLLTTDTVDGLYAAVEEDRTEWRKAELWINRLAVGGC